MQDTLFLYGFTIGGKQQSAGNAASSGLAYPKINIESAFVALLVFLLNTSYLKALDNDDLQGLTAELQQVIDQRRENPLAGTLMDDAEGGSESTESCNAHGKVDCKISECRMERLRPIYDRNKAKHVNKVLERRHRNAQRREQEFLYGR